MDPDNFEKFVKLGVLVRSALGRAAYTGRRKRRLSIALGGISGGGEIAARHGLSLEVVLASAERGWMAGKEPALKGTLRGEEEWS